MIGTLRVVVLVALGAWGVVGSAAAQQQQPSGYPPPYNYPPPSYVYPAPQPPGYPSPYVYPPPPYVRPPRPGRHEHDKALYVHLFAGASWLQTSAQVYGSEQKISGIGPGLGAAVGGAVIENLILFGELDLFEISDPTTTVDGVSRTAGGFTFAAIGVGPGVAYYFMPHNLFVTASVGLAKLTVTDDRVTSPDNVVGRSKWGFGMSAALGKEFWISDNWGLGVAAQYHFDSVESSASISPEPQFHTHAFAILASATFN